MSKTIWALIGLLVGSWIVAVVFKIAEDFIHFLLVIAGALGVANFLIGRRNSAAE